MQVHKSVQRKFTGELLEPIDIRVKTFSHRYTEKQASEALERFSKELFKARKAKALLLAKYYGIDVGENGDLSIFWCQLAFCLAIDFVPGFRAVGTEFLLSGRPRKWAREYLESLVELIDDKKAEGIFKTDFDACLSHVKAFYPELKFPSRASEARQKARTLQNLISRTRQSLKRKTTGASRTRNRSRK